jgi:hypothetical protein
MAGNPAFSGRDGISYEDKVRIAFLNGLDEGSLFLSVV